MCAQHNKYNATVTASNHAPHNMRTHSERQAIRSMTQATTKTWEKKNDGFITDTNANAVTTMTTMIRM